MTIEIPHLKDGATLDSSDQNDFMDDLETLLGSIAGTNIKRESVASIHLDTTDAQVKFAGHQRYSGTAYNFSDSSYTTIDAASDPCEVAITSTSILQGQVVKMNASVLTGVPVRGVGVLASDEYAFRFYMTYNIGGGDLNAQLGPEFVYSMTGCNTTGTVADDFINWTRHLLVWDYIHTSSTTYTITKVQLQIKLRDADWTLPVSKYNIGVIILRG